MTVRLIDVARAAGVSRSSASNVFSNPDRVRPELRKKVEAAAQALGYAGPDPKGQILRAGKINSIGVVAPGQWGVADTLRNPVFAQFLQGVGQACDAAGANMVILPDTAGNRGIGSALVDGFIFGRAGQLEQLEAARRRSLPFAAVDFDGGPSVNTVLVDAYAGAKVAARHLLELGHRRFGLMSFLRGLGPARLLTPGEGRDLTTPDIQIDRDKLSGFSDALAEAGLAIDDVAAVIAEPFDASAAAMLLDAAPGATAIFSMSIMQAIAVVKEALRRGMDVPRDLSVVGFNDIPEAALCNPPVTTIDSCTMDKGRIAAECVLAGDRGRRVVLSPRLLIRQSTAEVPKPR